MYVIVVGGGKVGFYLTRTLLSEGFEVTLLEKNKRIYDTMQEEFEGAVMLGDGTNINDLHSAGAARADLLVSVTGYDQDNLVACQLAKRKFGIKRTIGRVNNPKNEEVLRRLGVDSTVSSTGVIFSLIEQEVAQGGFVTSLTPLRHQGMELAEIELRAGSPAINRPLQEIKWPEGTALLAVSRGETLILPDKECLLAEGDMIMLLTKSEAHGELRKLLSAE